MSRCLQILAVIAFTFVSTQAEAGKLGGYSKVYVTDKSVLDAAQFAVKAQKEIGGGGLELVKVLSAEQQVVAGVNYKLVLSVKENGKARTAEVVVWWQAWRKPESYVLTSWDWSPARELSE